LEKYKIGKLKGPGEHVRFKEDSGFYKTVRERCGKYFRDNNIDPVKQSFLYEMFRFANSMGAFLFFYYVVVKWFREWNFPLWLRLLSCIPIGSAGLFIILNIAHMSSHVPTFHMPKLSYYLGWLSFDVCLGESFDIWLHEHAVGHHQYTNIISIDPNAPEGLAGDPGILYRGSPIQPWYDRFRYQYIYLPLISFLLVIETRLSAYRFFFKGFRKEIRANEAFIGTRSFILFLLGKILFYYRMYYVPIVWWKYPVWEIFLIVWVIEMVAGYLVSFFVHAQHVTDSVYWPQIRTDEKTGERMVDIEWAVMQVQTVKDYSYKNWFFIHVFGSMNIHSCHHLMPALHHSHYNKIYPILKQTAKEYGIAMYEVESFPRLIHDYVLNLWKLGLNPKKEY
jgi:linoleoyl-CoA desaturase